MPGNYVIMVGADRTPSGRARASEPSEWTRAPFFVPTPEHPDDLVDIPALTPGAKVWIWCHEEKEFGNGLGLTGVGVAADTRREGSEIALTISHIDLYRRPLGFERFLTHVKDDPVLRDLYWDRTVRTRYLTDPEALAWKRAIARAHNAIEAEARAYELSRLPQAADSEFFMAVARERWQPETPAEYAPFAEAVIDRDGICAVTGSRVRALLEAAQIVPFQLRRPERLSLENGLTLRCDIHRLYVCDLIRIDPDHRAIAVHPTLEHSEYARLAGRPVPDFIPEIYLRLEAERRDRLDAPE